MARFRQGAQDRMGVIDWRRHIGISLTACIAKHDALVASSFIFVARRVDTLGNIGGLRVDVDLDLRLLPMEALLLVTDFLHAMARDFLERLLGDAGGAADFTGQDDEIRRHQRLAGDPRMGIGSQEGIDDRIRDAIADLVRVTLESDLAEKEKTPRRNPHPLKTNEKKRTPR